MFNKLVAELAFKFSIRLLTPLKDVQHENYIELGMNVEYLSDKDTNNYPYLIGQAIRIIDIISSKTYSYAKDIVHFRLAEETEEFYAEV